MTKRKALGRGLGAYFPDLNKKENDEETNINNPFISQSIVVNSTKFIDVSHIRVNPNQPRKEFDELRLQELSQSIQDHGLIQPITVRSIGSNRFELISGERRLRATKMAGIDEIPAYIREADDNQSIAFALIENIQREDLNPIEVALAYQQLIDECDLSQEQVAKQVGKNRTTVTNMLRLLNLPPIIQAALKDRKISMGHARSLLSIQDEELQEKMLHKTIEEDFSVRQVEDAVRKILNKSTAKKQRAVKSDNEIHLKAISKRLETKFSTKIDFKKKQKGGEIRIDYYSEEDLERIISLLESIN